MTEVVVYRVPWCPFCVAAANQLRRAGACLTEVDVSYDPEKRHWLREVTGQCTVPQIFVNGSYVGGLPELVEARRTERLHGLLAERPRARSAV